MTSKSNKTIFKAPCHEKSAPFGQCKPVGSREPSDNYKDAVESTKLSSVSTFGTSEYLEYQNELEKRLAYSDLEQDGSPFPGNTPYFK